MLNSPLLGFSIADVPGVDSATVDRVGALNVAARRQARCRCGIVAFSAADAPDLALP